MASPRRDPVGDNLSCLFAVRTGRDIRRSVRSVLSSAKRDLTSAGTPAQSDGAIATGEEAQLAEVVAALHARDCARLVQLTRAASTDAVREAGCIALANVVKTYDVGSGSADTTRDVVEVLLSIACSEATSADLLAAAFKALHEWCMLVPHARLLACEAGALDAVVKAMRADIASTRLQSFGCSALYGMLYRIPANEPLLPAEASALRAVLAAMRTHASCESVLFQAWDVLCLMVTSAFGRSAARINRDAAVAHGAIELVAAALVRADAKTSSKACWALTELMDEVPENVARANRCGAFQAIVEAISLHVKHVKLQSHGCTALGRMGLDSAAFADAARLGAHAAIIHAMERFPSDSTLQESGCAALALLLPIEPSPDNDGKHAGAVACVVNALRGHVADADVQRSACGALVGLVENQPLNNAKAFQLGAFAALAEVLKAHAADADVAETCLAALRSICWGTEFREAEDGPAGSLSAAEACVAIRCVAATIRAYPEVLCIQRHGIAVVGMCLSFHAVECSMAAAEAGVLDATVAAARSFVDNVDLTNSACIFFARISELWSSLRLQGIQTPAAYTTDAVAATVTALHKHSGNEQVLRGAAYALQFLCFHGDLTASRSMLCSAVAPLCAALCHANISLQRSVLNALCNIVLDASAAVAAVSAGPGGIGSVILLLLRSTPAQDLCVLKHACIVVVNVACCAEAKLASSDAVAPLMHVLANCSQQNEEIIALACAALIKVVQCSRQHAAEAVRLGAAAAVPHAMLAHREVAALLALLEKEAEEQAQEALAQAQAQTQAREEAARRADAIAAELIAEEEEAARAAAAPPSRKSRKKRGGGASAAGGQRAEPASSETPPVPNAAPDSAAK